ncbi:biliverdin-producing heme oxygenase [Robbsia sp. Bb-Pol-6]|uniref:Biliverdin-producing heme oxygenase n=1 Tax=Robbsia betulipollinis TaxID=2981849 RepID=A0ABT3ZNE9_9BURK|nr:biliverdin-producing heme oxygenase [Robbsia betulipollinis]MCY0388054.1 biliverdin-producing heme oxygenase [Robbsia betulipollinis]
MTELLTRLKNDTADAHEALERALDLARPEMARPAYVALLEGFRGFVAPWEARLAVALPERLGDFAREREKTPLLDADLRHLSGGACDPAALPVCTALPALDTLPRALGSMYVMEGSTLGGRFIGPAMARRFGLSEHLGYGYFDPYREHTGSMWNAFKVRMAEEVAPEQAAAAVAAARETFAALHVWLAPRARA